MSFEHAVDSLGESFSEIEADLEKDIYDVLSPHIRGVLENSQELIRKAERIKNVSEFISVLLNSPEVTVSDATLSEFKQLLAEPRERATDFVFSFRFDANPQQGARGREGTVVIQDDMEEDVPADNRQWLRVNPRVHDMLTNAIRHTRWEEALQRVGVDAFSRVTFTEAVDWVQRNG